MTIPPETNFIWPRELGGARTRPTWDSAASNGVSGHPSDGERSNSPTRRGTSWDALVTLALLILFLLPNLVAPQPYEQDSAAIAPRSGILQSIGLVDSLLTHHPPANPLAGQVGNPANFGLPPSFAKTSIRSASAAPGSVPVHLPIATIPIPHGPDWATYDPLNGYVYVSASGNTWEAGYNLAHNITILDGTTIVTTIDLGSPYDPGNSVYDPTDGFIYVVDGQNTTAILNGTTVVTRSLPVGGDPIYDRVDHYIYSIGDSSASVVNGTRVIATIRGWSWADYATCDNLTGEIYVDSEIIDNVTIINGTRVVASMHLPDGPHFSAFDPANGFVYVGYGCCSLVTVINGTAVLANVSLNKSGDPTSLIYDNRDGYVYVYESYAGGNGGPQTLVANVSVIDGTKVIAFLRDVGGSGSGYLFLQNGMLDPNSGYVYFPNNPLLPVNATTNVSVFDGTQMVASFDVGKEPVGGVFDPANGYLYVLNYVSNSVSVIDPVYTVTLQENGLPGDTPWSVLLGGAVAQGNTSNLTFSEFNGTYSFGVTRVSGFAAVPDNGTITVDDASVLVTVNFSATYRVLFNAVGLPPGTTWTVRVDSGPLSSSQGSTLSTNETNGTHPFSVSSSNTLYASAGGAFSIRGAPVQVDLTFRLVNFSVDFAEMGLPSFVNWSVNVGGYEVADASASLSIMLPNGTYSYTLGRVAGWTTPSFQGQVAVSGADVSVVVRWMPMTYFVTATAVGLPTGVEWWLNSSGNFSNSSGGSTLSVSEPNGTYAYLVGTSDKTYAAPAGTLTISGRGVDPSVVFSRVTYPVTFVEEGLPAGTSWSVMFDSYESSRTAPANISIGEIINGTHSFSLGPVPGYSASPDKGSIVVSGTPGARIIRFEAVAGSPTNPPAVLGLPPYEGYSLIAGILVVAVAAASATLILGRRRRDRERLAGQS